MLVLKYFDAVDQLQAADQTVLQSFPRDQPGDAAPEAALSQAVRTWLTAQAHAGIR